MKTWLIRWVYRRIADSLLRQTPEDILAKGEKNLLRAFRRAAKRVPAYARLLARQGIDPKTIQSAEDVRRRVPLIDKKSTFQENRLADVCAGGTLKGVRGVYSSSGHSGVFSFGVETWKGIARAAMGVEFLLDQGFRIFERKTFLINALPMGVKIHTRSLPVAETSVRADVIHAIVQKLAKEIDQFILVGESPFLKKVLEEGVEQGIRWNELSVSALTGGEYIAENGRAYLEHLLGRTGEGRGGNVFVSMGISELGLSIFRETPETAQLRRLAGRDKRLRQSLFGEGVDVCPLVMQYWPGETYLETVPGEDGHSELVVSTVEKNVAVPLIRYRTGDRVRLVGYREMGSLLKSVGLENLLPKARLPLAFVEGRSPALSLANGQRLSVNAVKEALYKDFALAGKLTGNFRLVPEEGGKVLLQLREGVGVSADMEKIFLRALEDYSRAVPRVEFLSYRLFPYGMELDYERKNRYL